MIFQLLASVAVSVVIISVESHCEQPGQNKTSDKKLSHTQSTSDYYQGTE